MSCTIMTSSMEFLQIDSVDVTSCAYGHLFTLTRGERVVE